MSHAERRSLKEECQIEVLHQRGRLHCQECGRHLPTGVSYIFVNQEVWCEECKMHLIRQCVVNANHMEMAGIMEAETV
jgi:Zn finger protein HypA/HybF involved in hydrogenase expression